MLRAYRYRIYPSEEQKILFAKTFGCCRVVYNWALDVKKKLWEEDKQSIGVIALTNKMKAELKTEKEWLREVNSQSLQSAVRNCDTAFKNFFNKTGKYPKFKDKYARQAFTNPQHCTVDYKKKIISIPKAKDIKTVFHRTFKGEVRQITIVKEPDGRYYASILTENREKLPEIKESTEKGTIGIDTGIKSFAVLSTGKIYENVHIGKKEANKLKHCQRQLKRKTKGSRAYKEVRHHIAVLNSKIGHRRNDYLDKVTHEIVCKSQADTICVENLNVKGMLGNHHLAYSIADVALGEFYRKLKYKCQINGLNYVEIDRFAPSSKMCSNCGSIYQTLKLSEREWTCKTCHTHHDRDFNASVNIKNIGLKTLRSERAEVKPVDCPLVDDKKAKAFPKKQWQVETGKVQGQSVREASQSLVAW